MTIVHDTVVFFYVHTYEWLSMCSFMCCIRGLSVVRTIITYISTYRTSLSVWYNCVYSIWWVCWPHHTLYPWLIPRIIPCVATMDNTYGVTMRCNQCIYHMIFCGDNTHTIHSMALCGVSMGCHVCLYTPPILNAI